MPFIHVKSLPFQRSLSISETVEALSREFAAATAIELRHVTVTWKLVEPGHYAVGGCTVEKQPLDSHPVLVDLLVPDFNSSDQVERMLITLASSISRLTGIPEDNLFINCRLAASGFVFDAGEIVHW